eukprot:12764565-Heterocapsa_arctica.AAC.1
MQPNVAATEPRSESAELTQRRGASLMRLRHAVHLGSRPNLPIDLSGQTAWSQMYIYRTQGNRSLRPNP